ncbi:hypothetical protein Fcan01_11316 [Folsomia candida]|uniref:Uncharacterized protein n=1 Tax=Folsomia candida TaxID=158441 RepID=A0A226EBL4_FOLCA|nr:hypothetical protein Fcan01_11316 [Folsomia candida]
MKPGPFASKFISSYESYLKYYRTHNLQSLPATRINEWIEEEVVACGKSVFFADSERIELQRLNFEKSYPKIKFYTGKEPLLKEALYLPLYSSLYSKVPRLFETMMESGLLQVLFNNSIKAELELVMNKTKNIIAKDPAKFGQEERKFNPQKLKSSLVTLFVIMGALIWLGGFCFTSEYGNSWLKGCSAG